MKWKWHHCNRSIKPLWFCWCSTNVLLYLDLWTQDVEFKVNYSSFLHINKTKDMWDGIVNKAICTDTHTHTLKLTSSVCSHCNLESNTFATSVKKIPLIAPPPLTHTHIMAPLHTSSQNMQFNFQTTLWLSLYRGCWLVSPQVWFYTCRWEVWAFTSSSHCCLCQQTTTKKGKKSSLSGRFPSCFPF